MAETLSKEERDAVKERAKELRAQAKAGKSRAAGEKAVQEAIAKLDADDKKMAEAYYRLVSEIAPQLVPKTMYGMPGFANDQGKMVTFLQPAGKFKTRYATVSFDEASTLDDGDMWPNGFAVLKWTPEVEKRIGELVRAATK